MMFTMPANAAGLCDFIDASPSPFHACATVAARLVEAGYVELGETDRWPDRPGRYFIVRAGSLVAWNSEDLSGAILKDSVSDKLDHEREPVV